MAYAESATPRLRCKFRYKITKNMEIVLMTVGKTSISYLKEGINEYLKRLKRYIQYSIVELPDSSKGGKISEGEQKIAEGKLIIKNLREGDWVILLDERGREFTSREFAVELEKLMASGRKRIVYIIGGPYGFSDEVYSRCDSRISLSKMTFNHEMVRLFFTEQIYRAVSILHGLPYHHD